MWKCFNVIGVHRALVRLTRGPEWHRLLRRSISRCIKRMAKELFGASTSIRPGSTTFLHFRQKHIICHKTSMVHIKPRYLASRCSQAAGYHPSTSSPEQVPTAKVASGNRLREARCFMLAGGEQLGEVVQRYEGCGSTYLRPKARSPSTQSVRRGSCESVGN